MTVMNRKPINIFWTGGWDSTFRLLQLLIIEEKVVQPHFVVRAQPSVGYEINTMINIRRQIFRRYPGLRDMLLPTKYIDIREIDKDTDISECLKEINNFHYLANQYQFLASYCKQNLIKDIELSIESHRYVGNKIFIFIAENLSNNNGIPFKLEQKEYESELKNLTCKLFQYFKFPIIHLTKMEMRKYAQEYEFDAILGLAWFCATPWRGKPCGFCGPCIGAIKKGFPNKIPLFRRLLSRVHLPLRSFYRKNFKNY